MDRRRALDKLRKLLALAERAGNPHEAASARARADALMDRHHLTEEDVVEHESTAYHEISLGDRGWTAPWRLALVTVAARARGVEAIVLQDGRRRKVRLCGERGKVGLARQLYLDLLEVVRDLERLALDEYGDELGELVLGDSARDITLAFRQGAAIGVAIVLDRASRTGGEEPAPASGGGSPPSPEGGAEMTKLVRRSERIEHSEKIREKYAPRERTVIAADEVSEPLVFDLGRRLAASRVTFGEDGSVIVRWKKSKKVPVREDNDLGVDT